MMKRIAQLLVLLLMVSLTACMKDDLEECGVKLNFRYTYHMKPADAFAEEVSAVKVWVFDGEEKLVDVYTDQRENLGKGYALRLPHLPGGSYTFVAMAKSVDMTGEYADFNVPALSKGAPMDSLWARLQRDGNRTNACALNSLLVGIQPVELSGKAQQLVMEMMKCTHRLRILLVPMEEDVWLEADQFDFWIEGKNGWLAYDASTYREDPIIYRPYYQEVLQDSRTMENQIIVAELSTSRLIYELEPRLKIGNRETGAEILDIPLTWLLSLQAIEEHRKEWGPQEYLDRQDEYTLTFLIDGHTWMQGKVIVNGWVFSLSDIGL